MKEIIELYRKYNIELPYKIIFKREDSVIYNISDPKEGEELFLHSACNKSSSISEGLVFYKGKNRILKTLINIKDYIIIRSDLNDL